MVAIRVQVYNFGVKSFTDGWIRKQCNLTNRFPNVFVQGLNLTKNRPTSLIWTDYIVWPRFEIRTHDHLPRKPTLYKLSYWGAWESLLCNVLNSAFSVDWASSFINLFVSLCRRSHDIQVIFNFFITFDNIFELITKIRLSNNSFEFINLITIKHRFWYALLQKSLKPILYLTINSECLW